MDETPHRLFQRGKPALYESQARIVPEADEQLRAKLLEAYMHAYNTYLELTESGMKKEQARTVLPLGLYTTFFWTVNLRSLFNFLELRTSEHAQYEMREYALAVRSIVCEKLPVICRHKFVEVEK